jgi:hypothetical protein
MEKWLNVLHQIKASGYNIGDYKSAISSPPNPVFATCVWGFTEIIDEWLKEYTFETCPAPEMCNRFGRSTLCIASEYGNLDVVQQQLTSNAAG